ncbi:DUF4232 domain-containing protein [Streptomyces sp. PsTaAH-124]|nr:DUF4232 domain-containing protein [Streptomyces sp. PsTaAH-124]
MRRALLVLPVALATGGLLLTACGTEQSAARGPGAAPGRPSAACAVPAPSGAPGTPGTGANPDYTATDRVRTVIENGCPAFEVTNDTRQTLTYTITYQLLTNSATAQVSAVQTVTPVAPGRTVRRTVDPGVLPPGSDGVAQVRVIKVRSVPTAEAPSETGPCPPSGVRVYADRGDAAMGLRVVGLHLANCGTRAYRLDGYPQLRLFDQRHRPVDGVRVLHGGAAIATGTGADGEPTPLVLAPGESARATLVWRNTTGLESDPVDAPYVRVVAGPGAAPVTVTPELDLGTTGKLGTGAWQKDTTPDRPATRDPGTTG